MIEAASVAAACLVALAAGRAWYVARSWRRYDAMCKARPRRDVA